MYARIATFQAELEAIDETLERLRGEIERGDQPEGLEDATGVYVLVDRANGHMMNIVFFESERGMKRGDEALNAMNPPETMGSRTGVAMFEVPISRTR